MRTHGMGLLAELFDFGEGAEEEARAWLDGTRLARMLEVPGARGGAGYEAVDGAPRFLNLVEADSVHVFYGAEFAALEDSDGARPPRPPRLAGRDRGARPGADGRKARREEGGREDGRGT